MKVKVKEPAGFKPVSITITLESEAEANAFVAVSCVGMSQAEVIVQNAPTDVNPTTAKDVKELCDGLYAAVIKAGL